MARHGRQYPSARSRRAVRKVDDATIGTHVRRPSSESRASSQTGSLSYAGKRVAARASESHVDTFMPSATSGEDAAAYRRRSQHRRTAQVVQRKVRMRRILTGLLAAVVVVGLAVGAGWLTFRGVLGSSMALRDSDARDVLSAPKADETVYTLVAAELGATAQPLQHDGPDMIVLVSENRQSGKLALMSIPASLKVAVDNDSKRLADMAAEGDAAFISAVESYTKLDIHHYVSIPEGGIAGIVDALGDVEVQFDQVIDDPRAGDVYYPQGTYAVNGNGALTYLRASNLKMGKTDQMKNQASFAKVMLLSAIGSKGGFTAALDSLDAYFQTDLTLRDLESFARWVAEIGEANIVCDVVPGFFSVSQDIIGDDGETFTSKSNEFAAFIAGFEPGEDGAESQAAEPAQAAPDSFTVEILNGTDIVGAGKTTAEALDALGFRIAGVGNAEQQVYDETLVIYHTKNTPADTGSSSAEDADEGMEAPEEDEEGQDAEEAASDYGSIPQEQASDKQLTKEEEEAAAEAERELGTSRANAVIGALGIGRVVEGDMYYAFNADVLIIIGYDYKPVA